MPFKPFIKPAQGRWAAPIAIASMKAVSIRFCLEHRKLSPVTKQDFPIFTYGWLYIFSPQIHYLLNAKNEEYVLKNWDQNPRSVWSSLFPHTVELIIICECHSDFGMLQARSSYGRMLCFQRSSSSLYWCISSRILYCLALQRNISIMINIFTVIRPAKTTLKSLKRFTFTRTIDYVGYISNAKHLGILSISTNDVMGLKAAGNGTTLQPPLNCCSVFTQFVSSFGLLVVTLHNKIRRLQPSSLVLRADKLPATKSQSTEIDFSSSNDAFAKQGINDTAYRCFRRSHWMWIIAVGAL